MRNLTRPSKRLATALLGALLALAGCGTDHGGEHGDDITYEQAREAARTVASEFQGTSSLDFTMGLLGPLTGAHSRSGKGSAFTESQRPGRIGTLTADDGTFDYTVRAFDGSGSEVPWETTSWDQIARIVVSWNLKYDYQEAGDPSYWRGSAHGNYDISGLLATSDVMKFSGAAQDTFAYKFVYLNYQWTGDGMWQGIDDGLTIS